MSLGSNIIARHPFCVQLYSHIRVSFESNNTICVLIKKKKKKEQFVLVSEHLTFIRINTTLRALASGVLNAKFLAFSTPYTKKPPPFDVSNAKKI